MSVKDPEGDGPERELNDLGHLASGVGHHVINAFSAVVSNAEIFRLKLAASSSVDPIAVADIIINTAVEAAAVARRLIDYTRPITAIGDEELALDELVESYVAGQRGREAEDVQWATELASVPRIKGFDIHLRSMLDRFVVNAREAMARSSTRQIVMATSVDHRGWVALEIRDTGHGMAPEVLERAVEPFFSTKPGRLGVGLSIANGIWRRHRGTLSIQSRPGEGSTFRLCVEPTGAASPLAGLLN